MNDRTELRSAEREALYAPDRRLDAYYFGFDSTGSPAIDAILSAVACAGKGYHHTEGWDDKDSRWGEGRSHVDVIQAAAHEAAARDALRATLEGRCLSDITHRDEEHRQSVCMLPEGHAPLMHDDCMGCTWTDADHWQQSAVDRVADEVQRIADESQREGWDGPLVRILVGRISAALDGEADRD